MFKITALLGVRLLSYTGSYIGFLAMNIFILSLGFGPKFLAQIFLIRVISAILTSPLIGYISDIWDRKLMMVITDGIMATSVFILIIMPKEYLYIYIPIFMFIAGGLANVFDIALNASIPVILNSKDPKKLLKVNSWMLGGKHSAIIISGFFIALSYHVFKSYYAIFVIDALSYICSGLVIFFLKIETREKIETSIHHKTNSLISFIKSHTKKLINDYKSIFSLLGTYTIIGGLVLIFSDTFASSSHNIAWPVISKILHSKAPMLFYGFLIMAWGLGNVLGIYSTNKKVFYNHGSSSIENFYLFAQLIMSIGLGGTVLMPTQILAILFALIGGIGDGISKNLVILYGQQFKDSMRGKLFSIAGMINKMGFAFGFVVISLSLNLISIKEITILLHLLPITLASIFIVFRIKAKALNKNGL